MSACGQLCASWRKFLYIGLHVKPRLHAWHSHRQSRSHFTFSSLSDQWEIRLFFIFRNSFLYKITVSFTMVIKRSPGGQAAGGGRSTSKSTCEVPAWTLTAFGDWPASSMSKFSASVNSDLWVWSYQLTSDLSTCVLQWSCLKAVSVSTFVLGGLRGSTATSDLVVRSSLCSCPRDFNR